MTTKEKPTGPAQTSADLSLCPQTVGTFISFITVLVVLGRRARQESPAPTSPPLLPLPLSISVILFPFEPRREQV